MSNLLQERVALEEDIRYYSFILSKFKKNKLSTSWNPKISYTIIYPSKHLRLCSQIADILSTGTGDDSAMSVMVTEPSQTIGGGLQIRVFIVSESSFPAAPPSFKNSSVNKDSRASVSTTAASSRSVEDLLETAHQTVHLEQHIADVLAFIEQKATAGQVSTFIIRRCYRKIQQRLHADNLLLRTDSPSPNNSGLVQLLRSWAKSVKEEDVTIVPPYDPVAQRVEDYAESELDKLAPNRDPTAETVKFEFTSRNIGVWAAALALRLEIAMETFDCLVEGTPTMEDFDDAQYALASLDYFLRHHKDIWLTILGEPSFVTLALENWKYSSNDADYIPPGVSVSAVLGLPSETSRRLLQFLFNSVTIFHSIRTLRRLIKTQHDVQVHFEGIPQQPTLSKEDLKPRFLNDLAQRLAGDTPDQAELDILSSGPFYFNGSVHSEAFSMAEAARASMSNFPDFPKAVGTTRKTCFCCHYLGEAMQFDLPDTHGIILPWSPPPGLPLQILTELWRRLRELYDDLLDGITSTLQRSSEASSPDSDFDWKSLAVNYGALLKIT